jgi:hypothetical protein
MRWNASSAAAIASWPSSPAMASGAPMAGQCRPRHVHRATGRSRHARGAAELLAGHKVPEHTDLVVLASPRLALPPGASKALVDYMQNGGNLLWLTEPGNHDLGLQPLADTLGVRVLPGVWSTARRRAGLKDPRMIALGDYPPQRSPAALPDYAVSASLGAGTHFQLAAWRRSAA